jgi:thioredoxin 1
MANYIAPSRSQQYAQSNRLVTAVTLPAGVAPALPARMRLSIPQEHLIQVIGAEIRETTMAVQAIIEATDANFEQEVLKSEQPVLVDFWAAWCGPCKAIAPTVDAVATSYQGKAKIMKMDVDKNPSTPMRYNVRGIPTLLVFKGGQVKEQIVGYVAKDVIENALNKHI